MRAAAVAVLLASLALAGCSGQPPPEGFQPVAESSDGRGDVTVVAILDGGFDPYHWDFLASHMPQHRNDDPSDDLPLGEDPATWIPGHPGAAAFASHTRMDLTLTPDDGNAVPADLQQRDSAVWDATEPSDPTGDIHMRWIPGTKVVGYVDFTAGGAAGFATDSHGVGTTSVSVGNYHGTCPSCVFVFVNGYSDEAVTWVSQQAWIDAQSNSWGYSKVATEKMWTDCDLATQRAGVERGQQLFFSGGNGMANAFDAPVPTLYSCQKAPDWTITVGANTPAGATYTGSGKPVDLANVGSSYPSQGGSTVTGNSTFSGTSNATPVTMGLWAQALYELRRLMEGPSRMQDGGVLAKGRLATWCGDLNPDCALSDGELDVHEMRIALTSAAQLQQSGVATASSTATVPATTKEWALLSEGFGSFFGHVGDPRAEVDRIVAIATGNDVPPLDPDALAFAVAVSYCTQMVWGQWEHGVWGEGVDLPPADPQWPLRTWLVTQCPDAITALVEVADGLPVTLPTLG